jgi:very-short-patch-repair endonuclease
MPIGPYFADFACPSARLIIEVDGRTHNDDETQARDRERQGWLERQGWTVLRFRDEAIVGGMMVEDTIRNAVRLGLVKRVKM